MSNFEIQEFVPTDLKRNMFRQADRVLEDTPKDNLVSELGNSYTGKLFTALHGEGIVSVEFMALSDSAYEATEKFPRRPLRERRVLVQSLVGEPVYERVEIREITHPMAKPQPEIFICDYSCTVGEVEVDGMVESAVGFIQKIIDEDRAAAGFTPPVPDIVSTDVPYVAPDETGKFPSEMPGYKSGFPSPLYGDFEIGSHVLSVQRAEYLVSFLEKF